MTTPDALPPEMRMLRFPLGSDPLVLDEHTANGLLGQALPPDDAPPAYRDVAMVIRVLAEPASTAELEHETRSVSGIAAAIASTPSPPSRRSSMPTKFLSTKRLAVLATVGTISLFGGLAAAGALPGAAQQVAADALDAVGISVPSPNDASDGHADERGKSEAHPSGDESDQPAENEGGKGSEISETATTTDATGVDKGAEISDQASDGTSQAGDDHPDADVPTSTPSQADDGLAHRP